MKGKEAIIQKILERADNFSKEILESGEARANEILNEAQLFVDNAKKKVSDDATKNGQEILKRSMSVVDLESKKFALSLKQKLMQQCFEKALERLNGLKDTEYLALIKKLLQNAEDGETVTICAKDKNKISEAFLATSAIGKKLTLNVGFGDFDGGIILSKKGYEKNLTFDVLLKEKRAEIEPHVAGILFGVGK